MSVFKPYPNTVFRFRPYSPLSLKELQYSELFFVSRDELNDPYDTKSMALFKSDIHSYQQLVNNILFRNDINCNAPLFVRWRDVIDINSIVNFLASEERLYNELIEVLKSGQFEKVVFESFKNVKVESIALAQIFIRDLKQIIHAYASDIKYIASFSKKPDDPVMWSHYTNHHKGFCLCFSIEDNGFKLKSKQSQINRFKFHEVIYRTSNTTVNGFCMVKGISLAPGENFDAETFSKTLTESYLIKFESWQYEKEVRLIHSELVRANSHGPEKIPFVDRTFHYDLNQLTGIVYGARMGDEEKKQLENIIYNIRVNANLSPPPVFIFYVAEESSNSFNMEIRPVNGLDCQNKFFEAKDLDKAEQEYKLLKQHFTNLNDRQGR